MIQNLKQLRKKAGISQQALAEKIGVSQQSINKYENHNIEPDIETLIRLADFFNTSVDYLIGHTEIEHPIEPVSPYDLNQAEAKIIDSYRIISTKQKHLVLMIVENLAEESTD